MRKSKLVKIILIMVVGLLVLLNARQSFAAENNSAAKDLTSTLAGNNTAIQIGGNSTTGNNTVLKTNNTSNYNNTTLPKTGIGDSASSVILVVVLGISAVYAYKKIQYYKNI